VNGGAGEVVLAAVRSVAKSKPLPQPVGLTKQKDGRSIDAAIALPLIYRPHLKNPV
jgi:hypothetical protein